MTEAKFTARVVRESGDVLVFKNGVQFGRLANCEFCHVFESDDEELAERVSDGIEGDMSVREMLAVIRAAYERLDLDREAESAAEHYAENAWLRHAERYDHEAQADLDLHNELHPYGYY